MPWIAIVCACLVGACSFDADYGGGTYACHDGKCPSGLVCSAAKVCVAPSDDGGLDAPADSMADAGEHELTCDDPGVLVSGQPADGTTESRANLMQSSCGGGFQTAADAVYRITTTAANQQLVVTMDGSLSAYVLDACKTGNQTPACLGGMAATDGSPITVTATSAGDYFIVVDSITVTAAGPYTVQATVN